MHKKKDVKAKAKGEKRLLESAESELDWSITGQCHARCHYVSIYSSLLATVYQQRYCPSPTQV